MLNFHGEYAQYRYKASFFKGFINCFCNHIVVSTSHVNMVMFSVTAKVLWLLLRHTSFQYQCSGLTSRLILKVLWVSNVHHDGNDTTFWSCGFVRDCRVWGIFKDFYLQQKLFWSLWLMHCQLCGSEWCQCFLLHQSRYSTERDRSRIFRIYSLIIPTLFEIIADG